MSFLEGLFWTYAAVIGAAVGSFLNVCIVRLPEEESVVRPPSRCPGCTSEIAWYDNIPVLSWLWLRGRCRHCGEPISVQYPLVEAAAAAVWLGMAVLYGPTWRALEGAVLFSLLLGIAVVDARHYLIPDALSVGGLAAGLALSLLPGGVGPLESAAAAAGGYAVLWAVAEAGEWWLDRPAMGGGDMKLMAMIGAFLGPLDSILALFLGALTGTLVFGPVSLRTGKLVPFGVFLAVGAALAFLFGEPIADWYRAWALAG
ncbi:MAG: A24 family peptidase [Gemmatimonadota bacterium]